MPRALHDGPHQQVKAILRRIPPSPSIHVVGLSYVTAKPECNDIRCFLSIIQTKTSG